MTPQQKIKHIILNRIAKWRRTPPPDVIAENIDALYEAADEGDCQDARNEVRCTGESTGMPCPSSRHYEADAVAAKAPDGSWVGWTYWYGGGKHGEPEAIDWMEGAYNLSCTEEEKLVVVRTFTKAE